MRSAHAKVNLWLNVVGRRDDGYHLLDSLVAFVDLADQVAGQEAGLRRRRIVDRRDHLDQAVLHRDLDAKPAELTAGLHLHVAETFRVHVARMRVKPGEHAVDGRFNELAVVRFFDVVGAHALEHIAEQIELTVGIRNRRARRRADQQGPRLGDQQRCQHAGQGAEKEQ